MQEIWDILKTLDYSPLWISLKTGLVATVICFFLGIWTAKSVMKMGKRAKAFVDGLLTLPMVLPPTVAGFFLLLVFSLRRPIGFSVAAAGMAGFDFVVVLAAAHRARLVRRQVAAVRGKFHAQSATWVATCPPASLRAAACGRRPLLRSGRGAVPPRSGMAGPRHALWLPLRQP